MTAEDILLVNCAECGRELLGESQDVAEAFSTLGDGCPPSVAGRINDRPHCAPCMRFIAREQERRLYRELRGLPV